MKFNGLTPTFVECRRMNGPDQMHNALAHGPATILIVDDDTDNLDILSRLLDAHYHVFAAPTGERALAIATGEHKPDLILLDVLMPHMDGYDVLAQLRENPSTNDIPVIFVTGLDSTEDEAKGFNLGAVDYITKPYRSQIILARVHTQLELKRARDFLSNHNRILEEQVSARTADLQVSEERFRVATQCVRDAFIIMDGEHGTIVEWNIAAERLFGYSRDEVFGKKLHGIVAPFRFRELAEQGLKVFNSNGTGVAVDNTVEFSAQHKNGEEFPVELSVSAMRLRNRLYAVGVVRDITERKRYQSQLERRANYDEMTGLPNRNLLTDRLSHTISRCHFSEKSLFVFALAPDHFKETNDGLGHAIAEKLLVLVSKLLGTLAARFETIAYFGGETFILLLEAEDLGEVATLAQNILKLLEQPFFIDDHELFPSASIGIAQFPKDGDDHVTLLKNANAAMCRGKNLGGNCFSFYAREMNAHSLEQLKLENELRHAVEREELELYYQPQVSLRSGEIIGVEALIRWRHPTRGLVSPLDFIPLAERSGLIIPIGEWVMRTACTQNQAWLKAGLSTMAVAVNLSARQFDGQDFVAQTVKILQETGLDPGYLELELTESTTMDNPEVFSKMTEELKALAITLSIDDFGTGYSSLSYLKRFSLDRLKIDQSFVRDIVHDPDSASISVAIIGLAHSLGLSVIAEGVETEEQMSFLRSRGCDEMQGYYFSKPLPAHEFEQLLVERRTLPLPAGDKVPSLLIVDDDESVLLALKRLLRREGYPLLTAGSGQEGLDLLATHNVAVVVSDQRMPNMSGAEFLGKVRGMYPDTIRIILSGYHDINAVTDVINHGEIYKFLDKPWENASLLETLRGAFRLYEHRYATKRDFAISVGEQLPDNRTGCQP